MTSLLFEKHLAAIKNSDVSIGRYANGIDLLRASGVLDLLREVYKPTVAATYESQVLQSSFAAGALDVLDKLANFKEWFLIDSTSDVPKMEFGASDRALDQGYLTKEEIDARRNNTSPDYSKYTKRTDSSAKS